ncbi:hypothetical protein [Flavobacterium turcicum]|uniref:Uncharacterized protein n=1 Tax=Flavobacterium turcicum TaxID=2764718 RepID=A0ABR7JEU4_9FLAO|nr:hypothetical protein [Flavobacterium turcicum]MBC5863024.1 hypothetical protein [Flavobacterium turcicum]NHL01756.1 hypothetical protein [Flavobacterium turcicum]
MTKKEFIDTIAQKNTDLITNYILSILVIILSIYLQVKFYSLFELNLSKPNFLIVIFIYIVFISLFALGCYGIFALANPLKISYWHNERTIVENNETIEQLYKKLNAKNFLKQGDTIQFEFKKSFWSYSYKIYFLAEDKSIALTVKGIDSNPKGGFLDFGAKYRMQKKIINMLK